MGDRFVVIVVSLLTLIVICGLTVMAVRWLPSRIAALDERMQRIEDQRASLEVIHNKLAHIENLRTAPAEAKDASNDAAALARIDGRVDELSTRMAVVVTETNKIQKLPQKSDLNALESKVNALSAKLSAMPKSDPALARLSGEVAKLKASVAAAEKALEKKIDETQRELKRINLLIQKLDAQIKKIPSGTS